MGSVIVDENGYLEIKLQERTDRKENLVVSLEGDNAKHVQETARAKGYSVSNLPVDVYYPPGLKMVVKCRGFQG